MLPSLSLSEILLIALIALLVLRPKDLPQLMHQAGIWWVQIRANVQGLLAGLNERDHK